MSSTQIRQLLSELRLNGITDILEKTLADGTQTGWSYLVFLDVLLQAEADHRDKKKIENRIKNSKLKRSSSFEDFDFTAKRSVTKAQVKELYSMKWLEDGRPLGLIGQTGIGKTYLAQAIGLRACQLGKTVVFLSASTFLEQQILARSTLGYLKFKEKLTKPDLLIIDDFGLRKFNPLEAEDLREILEERSYGKATLVTTQLPLDHWSEVLPVPVLSEAIIDRIEGMALQIKITGESYRRIKAKKLDQDKETQ